MNPCRACKSEDGPRLLGPIAKPRVQCECGAEGPSRATAEAAMHAWNAINPDNSPQVHPLSGHQRATVALKASWKDGKAPKPAQTLAPTLPTVQPKPRRKTQRPKPRGVCGECGGKRYVRSKLCLVHLQAKLKREYEAAAAKRANRVGPERGSKWAQGFSVAPPADPADVYIERGGK